MRLKKKKLVLTMSPLKPNKLSQERNSYLILFPRYSGESFKMWTPCINKVQYYDLGCVRADAISAENL